MGTFLLSEKYRLEIHWKSVEYIDGGLFKIKGCYLSGPVLTNAVELQPNDNIVLDFCEQYSAIVTAIYTAKFSWSEVVYKENKIYLEDTFLHYYIDVKDIPMMKNNDYLVIDTSNHEMQTHAFNILYKTYVVDKDNKLYNFRK